MKIGGFTGWLRAAALAESAGVPLSSHLFPEQACAGYIICSRPVVVVVV